MTKERHILFEMATITPLKAGYGFAFIIHTNDHNPPHIHLYKSADDIISEKYYTRLIIPETQPKSINDIHCYEGDIELNTKEKKIILNWFNQPYKKDSKFTNHQIALIQWDIYQNKD